MTFKLSRRTFIAAGIVGAAALVTAGWLKGPHAPRGAAPRRSVHRAFLTKAEIQFAAGAARVSPAHAAGGAFTPLAQAGAAIGGVDLRPLVSRVASAHAMGGAALGADPRSAAVDVPGRHHHLANPYVVDGSLFLTSIGASPKLSIQAVSPRLATALAAEVRARRAGEPAVL